MFSVQTIEEWADSRVQTFPLQHLAGAVIGVDASYYLDLRLNKALKASTDSKKASPSSNEDPSLQDAARKGREPLFNALGGVPCSLQDAIEKDIQILKKHDISLTFIFNGLDYATKEPSGARSATNLRAHEEGWLAYKNDDEDATVKAFGKAGKKFCSIVVASQLTFKAFTVETLYRWFQRLLKTLRVQFLVAPYGAAAQVHISTFMRFALSDIPQLAYLEKQPEQFIDAVMSSTECFLFDVDKVILDVNLKSSTFTWLKKSECQNLLDKAPKDLFRDVQLILGSSFLPMFPLLGRNTSGKVTVREALMMLNTASRNVMQLCQQWQEDPQVKLLQYADRYKKAIMTIRHHVVLEKDGKIAPMDYVHAPGDVHEFIGQRLPEELFFYISKGMLGSQIPNWLATSEVTLSLPAGAQDSESYRRLVVDQLNPIRATTLKLITESMHRYYQSRTIKLSPWFEKDTSSLTITIKELPAVGSQLDGWMIKSSDLPPSKDGPSVSGENSDSLKSLTIAG